MTEERAEPPTDLTDAGELVRQYLDYYRDTVWAKVDGLSEQDLRRAVLPSGWSLLELLHHLLFVERRWLQWGFLGLGDELPRGDWDLDARRWAVPDGTSAEDVRIAFWQEVERSRRLVAEHELSERSARSRSEAEPPTLAWVLFHLLQEYARHAGHVDVVRELIDDRTGE